MLTWLRFEISKKAKASIAVHIWRNLDIKDIQDIQYVNERYLRLNLRIYDREITFLIYAPTDDSTAQMKEVFYEMLRQQFNQIRYRRQLILARDLNAKMGSRNLDEVIRMK